ncbi:MAG: peptidase S41, partial [Pirellulaceae bacterium]|nr:peptidase S41 [Pirellulaceae bacterium]
MRFPRTASFLSLALLMFLAPSASASDETRLLRFPDIHGDQVVFCHGGDLWRAPVAGGTATRLTAHPGQELFPKFSPDGKWVAFTGQYDGDEQVYVMPSDGGVPRQLTYYPATGPLPPRWGYDNQVYGWTPDGSAVLFRSLRDANGGSVLTALYTVPFDGGLPTKLPMPSAGAGDFSPDAAKMVYNPLFRDFRTWKRYEGGWAQDLYIFDLEGHDAKQIAASKRTEREPMWIGEAIYFVSDRDGTLDLFKYDIASDQVTKLTDHQPWDVRWSSSDGRERIVYEVNGTLRVYNVRTNEDRPISIRVPHDGLAMRPSRYSAEKNVESFGLSPKGQRAVFVARGDVFTVPIEKGVTRNLTNSSGAHDKWAAWSPDGARIAFISDRTGEDQLYVINQDGSGEPQQLTTEFAGMLYAPQWSPDGKRLAFSDVRGKLFVLTLEDKTLIEVADEPEGLLRDFSWSPKGDYLALSLSDPSSYGSIHIWSVADGKLRRVTGPLGNESNPVWDPEGNYLFFLAARDYAPQVSTLEWNFAGNRQVGIFALALRKDVPNLFGLESDEVAVDAKTDAEPPKNEEDADDVKPAHDGQANDDKKTEKGTDGDRIDFEGLADRVIRVPIAAENRGRLEAVKGMLLFVDSGAAFYGRESYAKPAIKIFDIKKRKASTLVDNASDYALSFDGSKMLFHQAGGYWLIDVKPSATDKKRVSMAGLMVDRVPTEEWAQIFDEVWRRFRDFFYVENMHGYDWKAIGDR